MNSRNFRIEPTFRTDSFVAADGTEVSLTYADSEASVHDETCSSCGRTHQRRGIMGGLKDIMWGDLCDLFRPPTDEDLPNLTEDAIDELRC